MDIGSRQIKALLAFVECDRQIIALEEDMRRLVELRVAWGFYQSLKQNTTSLKELSNKVDDDMYTLILDTVECPDDSLDEIAQLEAMDLKKSHKIIGKDLDDFLHELLDIVVPSVILKLYLNLYDDFEPVEVIFAYDNMGTTHSRLARHRNCIGEVWNRITIRVDRSFRGVCRNCGLAKVVKKCPTCNFVGFCSNACHRADLANKSMGHKAVECSFVAK